MIINKSDWEKFLDTEFTVKCSNGPFPVPDATGNVSAVALCEMDMICLWTAYLKGEPVTLHSGLGDITFSLKNEGNLCTN